LHERQPFERPVGAHDVDRAPVGHLRHGQLCQVAEVSLEVERRAEHRLCLGEERCAPLGALGLKPRLLLEPQQLGTLQLDALALADVAPDNGRAHDLPSRSRSGETVRDTSTSEPSLRRR
jgi:hypothetical protein